MKAYSASPATPFVLKTAGIMLILLYLLDFLLLLLSAKFQDSQWIIAFTTQLVDRGFLPLTGLAALFAAFWMEGDGQGADHSRGLKLVSLVLASILGLGFLLLIPMHVSTSRTAVDDQLKKVEQEATQAETQLNAQATQQLDSNLAQLEQVIKSGQLSADQQGPAQQQLDKLKKLKADPKAFEASIAPQKEQALKQVKDRRQEVETQLRETSLRSGLRTGLGGLLLAIAHAAIGWTGLRQLSAAAPRL